MKIPASLITGLGFVLSAAAASAAPTDGMTEGKPEFKAMSQLAFGPEGVLFVADTKAAAIVALDTGDTKPAATTATYKVEGVDKKVAGLLGTTADQILISDLAVNPVSRQVYLAVSRGRGPDATPVLVRVKTAGDLEVVSLDKIKFSKVDLPDAPADGTVGRSNPRLDAITDIAYSDGRVLVAGLSNEEFSSTLRAIPFPFKSSVASTSVEMYHGSHGRFETRSPVRTFAVYTVGKEPHLFAAYTCTPLVELALSELKPGAKIQGKTIAEFGNRNRPLDMIVYQKDGKDFLLLANESRGVMKVAADQISGAAPITERVSDTKGLAFEKIDWAGVAQLDRLDDKQAVVMRTANGATNLESLPLP